MAVIHGELEIGGALFERIVIGMGFAVVAALEAAGGGEHAIVAGFFAGVAVYVLRRSSEGARQAADFAVDFLVVAAFTLLCDRAGFLWRAPETLLGLFRFSPVGAATATLIYLAGVVTLRARSRMAVRAALFALPFLFSLLIALGAPPVTQIGGVLLLGVDVPDIFKNIAGRTLVLFLLNEAVVVGVPLALGRFLPRQWRPHGILFASAFLASLTPYVATSVSYFIAPYLPAPLTAAVATVAAALAQAGLWGQTYLVTQAIAGLLRATPSLQVVVFHDWRTGAEKGAVYGFVFMALLLAVGLVVSFPPAVAVISASGPIGGALIGAALFPLARAIVESTDSTPPFFARVEEIYLHPSNYLRGVVAGAAVGLALMIGLPAASGGDRFLFGAAVGALAYAGVDAAIDFFALTQGRRQHLRSWRVYSLGALLGGLVAGAIAWYLDTGQVDDDRRRNSSPISSLDYAADGRPIDALRHPPVVLQMGRDRSRRRRWRRAAAFRRVAVRRDPMGVRRAAVLDQSVLPHRAGAAQPRAVAPTRELARARHAGRERRARAALGPVDGAGDLFLPEGVAGSDLVQSGRAHPHRRRELDEPTSCRTMISAPGASTSSRRCSPMTRCAFSSGSTIWVCASRPWSICPSSAATSPTKRRRASSARRRRAAPFRKGIRRFGTWAPLLLPFYIPRGAEWDKAWSAAEHMSQTAAAVLHLSRRRLSGLRGSRSLSALVLFLLVQLARAAKLPLEGHHRRRRRAGLAALRAHQWPDDEPNGSRTGRARSRIEGVARGGPPIDLTRRPDDHAHPRGRFLFLREEGGELWSLGEAPTALSRRASHRSQTRARTACSSWPSKTASRSKRRSRSRADEAVEITRLKIVNLEQRPRKLTLAIAARMGAERNRRRTARRRL